MPGPGEPLDHRLRALLLQRLRISRHRDQRDHRIVITRITIVISGITVVIAGIAGRDRAGASCAAHDAVTLKGPSRRKGKETTET
ncbi:hypothetical protein WMF04_18055 [Sorangium sp. So ce260]|uniref:hypothetical protein n=1 Tax=Sorangium sp. So ce260 TaxID=3133291 RepID=UPI003F616C69